MDMQEKIQGITREQASEAMMAEAAQEILRFNQANAMPSSDKVDDMVKVMKVMNDARKLDSDEARYSADQMIRVRDQDIRVLDIRTQAALDGLRLAMEDELKEIERKGEDAQKVIDNFIKMYGLVNSARSAEKAS
jgi:hypothetical protein